MNNEETMNAIVNHYEARIKSLTDRIRVLEDLNEKCFEALAKTSLRMHTLEAERDKKYKVLAHIEGK